jgi:hypothetical protein
MVNKKDIILVTLETIDTNQLLYFATIIWAANNKPYEIPEGGYIIDIKSAREMYLGWLNVIGRDEFITKTGIDRFFKSKQPKPPRVSKADQLNELRETIAALGLEVDEDLISKLTGKQAVYFSNILRG